MDIEGSEYALLKHMEHTKTSALIDDIEWHATPISLRQIKNVLTLDDESNVFRWKSFFLIYLNTVKFAIIMLFGQITNAIQDMLFHLNLI